MSRSASARRRLSSASVSAPGSRATPPGPDPAAAEPAAAQQRGQVQHIAAQPAAIGGGRQKADIAGERAEIADVIGDPLQFQRDDAQRGRPRRAFGAGQRLDQLAIGGRVTGGGIAGDRLGEMDASLVRAAAQRRLDAAMLVAERDFEMEDALAVAIEAEMPGLDDPGMHRADRDLVDLRAGDLEEIDVLDRRAAAREPHRLEPGVTLRADAALLVDFALEVMRGGAIGGQRRIRARSTAVAARPISPLASSANAASRRVSPPSRGSAVSSSRRRPSRDLRRAPGRGKLSLSSNGTASSRLRLGIADRREASWRARPRPRRRGRSPRSASGGSHSPRQQQARQAPA